MYERLTTKSGDVLWLRMGNPTGRHEIARMEYRTWERAQRREAYKQGIEL